eukprot:jgi/Chrpa1/20124/Chrysochromulina_OHIO_Genome00023062-RA
MDYSGVDSLISPGVSLVAIVLFNVIRFDKLCGFDKYDGRTPKTDAAKVGPKGVELGNPGMSAA